MSLLVLSQPDVVRIADSFSVADLCSLMAHVFHSISQPDSRSQQPLRTTLHLPHHRTLIMPSRISSPTAAAVKAVSVPTDPADDRGIPASTLVLDDNSGAVSAILNARSLTALRTAAGSSPLGSQRR